MQHYGGAQGIGATKGNKATGFLTNYYFLLGRGQNDEMMGIGGV